MYPLPAFGKELWNRRMNGEHPLEIVLMVGRSWCQPQAWKKLPRLAVRARPWHTGAFKFDWRLVAGCDVYACDTRAPADVVKGPADWDSWLWLLAEVKCFALGVWMFTPTISFPAAPTGRLAAEREIETYAWCNRSFDKQPNCLVYPVWWSPMAALELRAKRRG